MSLNWKEIDAVLAELRIAGSRIQKVRQPDFKSLVLDLYRPRYRFSVLISLEQGRTRLHAATHTPQSPRVPQRFVQLLRARIQGGAVTECRQVGEDRIVKLVVTRTGETTILWIRLWGGAANIVATDEHDVILDAFYRRPKRSEVSGVEFNPEKHGLPPKKGGRTYEVRDFPGEGTLSERIERHYDQEIHATRRDQLKERAERELGREESRLERLLEKLQEELRAAASAEHLKQIGDLIMSNLHCIERGNTWLKTQDYYHDNADIEIELDPSRSPEQNAERYYEKYKSEKSRIQRLEREIANAESSLSDVRAKQQEAQDTGDPSALESMLEPRKHDGTGGEPDANVPGLQYESGPFRILVGRTAKENDELLRHHVRGNDYWLHARDYPGGYVFIKSIPGKTIPLNVLLDAGNLAVLYSKARAEGRADLYYTQVKHLRRAKHGKTGLVIPTQEKNLSVHLDSDRLKKLQLQRQ